MGILDNLKSLFQKKNNEKKVEEKKKEVAPTPQVEQTKSVQEKVTVESLANEQKIIDKLYEAEGLSDRVLDMQVALNQKRNKYNISDKNNLNKDGWSQ